MADAQAQFEQLDRELKSVVGDLEKTVIRPIQLKSFKCSVGCAGDASLNMEQVQECYARCSKDAQRAGETFEHEMSSFWNIVNGCVNQCSMTANDNLRGAGGSPSQANVDRAQGEFEQCSGQCANQAFQKLGMLRQRVKSLLASY